MRIALVTEIYFPQINGVSRTLDRLVGFLTPTEVLAGGILGSGIGFVATVFVRHFLLP